MVYPEEWGSNLPRIRGSYMPTYTALRRTTVFRSSAISCYVTGQVVLDVSRVPGAFKAGYKQSEKILLELLEPTRLGRNDAAQRPIQLSQWQGVCNIPEDSNSQPQTWRPWVGNRTVLDCTCSPTRMMFNGNALVLPSTTTWRAKWSNSTVHERKDGNI